MSKSKSAAERFALLGQLLKKHVPNLNVTFEDESDFISLLVKVRPDGTCLAVVKKFGDDGGPLVLFGSGYGLPGALMAADAAAQGGKWRPDKPWEGGEKQGLPEVK